MRLEGVPAASGNISSLLVLQVTLAKMRSHVSSCAKVQEQMANCPKFVPVVPTSQPIPRYCHMSGGKRVHLCRLYWHSLPLQALKSEHVFYIPLGNHREKHQHLFPPGIWSPCPVFRSVAWEEGPTRPGWFSLEREWAGLVSTMGGWHKAEQGWLG